MDTVVEQIAKAIGLFVGGIAVIFVIALIATFPLFILWNWLMPVLFGFKVISYLQALGLLLLSGILFKNTSSTSSSSK